MKAGVSMTGPGTPDTSIDIYVAALTPEEKKAMHDLIMHREKTKKTWPELRDSYQRTADQIILFSMRGDLEKDIQRIDILSNFETKYGDISKYFANGANGSSH